MQNHPSGFSLIEMLIALTLLAFGTLALIKLQGNLLAHGRSNQQRATALFIARNKLAELNQLNLFKKQQNSQKLTVNQTQYQLDWSISKNTDLKYYNARITVSWNNALDQKQTIQLQSALNYNDPELSGIIMQYPG